MEATYLADQSFLLQEGSRGGDVAFSGSPSTITTVTVSGGHYRATQDRPLVRAQLGRPRRPVLPPPPAPTSPSPGPTGGGDSSNGRDRLQEHRHFRPSASTGSVGDLVNLLDKCLVSGYGFAEDRAQAGRSRCTPRRTPRRSRQAFVGEQQAALRPLLPLRRQRLRSRRAKEALFREVGGNRDPRSRPPAATSRP